MKPDSRYTRALEKWVKIIREWRCTKKSAKHWCREQKIGYTQFLVWRKRLEAMSTKEACLIFRELTDEKASKSIKIHFREFTISVPDQFEEQALLNCLKTLEAM